jgi:hypothetical protein
MLGSVDIKPRLDPSSGDIMLWTFGPEAGDLTALGQSRRRKMA